MSVNSGCGGLYRKKGEGSFGIWGFGDLMTWVI